MKINKNIKIGFSTVGGSSILTIFSVLCLVVFALLTLSTAKADSKLSNKSLKSVENYYKADKNAEIILARLRQGEKVDGVQKKGDTYTYKCKIDDNQNLHVSVTIKGNNYIVNQWKKVYDGKWEDNKSLELWEGSEE